MKKVPLDARDRAIIDELLMDSRTSQQAMAQQVGLSAPAVRERIRRLEQEDVIEAFTLDINSRALGYTLEALVRIEPLPGKLHIVERTLQDMPEIIHCDAVTGDDCFVARMVLRDIQDLNRLLHPLHDKARTNTSIIKGTPVRRRRPPFADE
ncbi:Lrp/AsnC family transcriptional regulator [Rhizobium deserti]|uniref:Lrp/AsnC family transcriptional regulator n=1 Tax=Rhizobium deserti TaxID=2547961 RepID=A0A4R5UB77_9HYPH|nr:Lrp/AsnC family transcriptional regulator [Rhizobium deserti]TDK32295.1 Lrp/AsnC family transcriptional regulator [Rhizobium deserti]